MKIHAKPPTISGPSRSTNMELFIITFATLLFFGTIGLGVTASCKDITPLEERIRRAEIVFRGVFIPNEHKEHGVVFSLETIYKGANQLAEFSPYFGSPYNTTDRQVNLSVPLALSACFAAQPRTKSGAAPAPRGSLVAARLVVAGPRARALRAAAPPRLWDEQMELAVLHELGWGDWTEWTPCSATCGGGAQRQKRACHVSACPGPHARLRKCNTFDCQGAVSPLDSEKGRPRQGRAQWARVPGRLGAWRLKADSYVWLPSAQLFHQPQPAQGFPKDFTLFLSLRLRPEGPSSGQVSLMCDTIDLGRKTQKLIHRVFRSGGVGQGTLFSLRSRRQQDAYLSLELSAGGARLVHAGANGSEVIHLPATLKDYRWHQIAISVHGDSTVRSYVDCRWLRTDVLQRNSLDTPKDADLIIGYLFSGDLEQLTVVPEAGFADRQCGDSEPIYGETAERSTDRDPT